MVRSACPQKRPNQSGSKDNTQSTMKSLAPDFVLDLCASAPSAT